MHSFIESSATIIFGTLILSIFASLLIPFFMAAPFVPTSRHKMQKILDLANIKKGEKLYDLGSGDGRFVIAAAKRGANAVGIEINPFQVWWSNFLIALLRLKNAKVVRANIFNYDISDADIVICYLWPETNSRLKPLLEKMLKPEVRVITHLFRFHGWEPKIVDKEAQIYVYAAHQNLKTHGKQHNY